MSVNTHEFKIERSNLVYTSGDPNNSRHLYLFHGYAQDGQSFLEEFVYLNEEYFIVSIEGSSKFYAKGGYGEIVNSWMTSYNRVEEIQEYIHLISQVIERLSSKKIIKMIGFSQGSQTAARWFLANQHRVHQLIMCGGLLPQTEIEIIDHSKMIYLIGDADRFIKHENIQLFQDKSPSANLHLFQGGHELNHLLIKELLN